MTQHDGKILASVRDELATVRRKNALEREKRRGEVFEKLPSLRSFDGDMASLMTGAVTRAMAPTGSGEIPWAKARAEEMLAHRRKLLLENGFPEDYLDEIYDCPKCRDTGYVEGLPCACLETRYAELAARNLSRMLDLRGQSFEGFDLNYYSGEYDSARGESPRATMSANLELCRKYADSFRHGSPNLLFTGGTGLGKTFLSASIARVVSARGFSVVYDTAVSVLDVFETLKFSKLADELPEYREAVNRYLGCDLLIFDDLGTEMTTTMTVSALYTLINTRMLGGKSTIISTNLCPDDLKRRYSPQITSRLEGEYIPVFFVGSDIRLLKNG